MSNQCGACGGRKLKPFSGETFRVGRDGFATEVTMLSGLRCKDCGEVYFDAESQARYATASDAVVMKRRDAERAELAKARKRLRLTQTQAAALTGGGHNAFSRYERGEVKPSAAVVNLFRLLDKHPELLRELAV